MNMKGVKVFSLAVVLAVGAAFGYQSGDPRTFYVAASGGSDDNDGLSREKPFATLRKGVSALCRNGDTLVVLKGHHYLGSEVPTYTFGSTYPSYTTIVGESPDSSETVIDGLGKYRALYWQSSGSVKGQRIANLTFQNLGNGVDFTEDSEGGTPFRTYDSQLVLSNCVFRNICVTNQYKTTNQAWTPLFIGGGDSTIVDCDFIAITNASPVGNCSGCYMTEAALHTFIRCKFEDCHVTDGGVVSLRFAEKQRGHFTDCLFRNNCSVKYPTCVLISPNRNLPGLPSSFTRCDFVGNVCGNGTPTVYAYGIISDTGFYDCGFSNNVVAADGGNVGGHGCVAAFSTNGFHRCTFSNNWNKSTGTFATAGIVFTKTQYYDDNAVLEHTTNIVSKCVFIGNHTMATGGTGLLVQTAGARVEDCVFEDNVAHKKDEGGGGAALVGKGTGGAVFCRFDRCAFRRNICLSRGGALNLHDTTIGQVEPCWVRNCLFDGNSSTNGKYNAGGALACIYFEDLLIENCTFITNYCYGTCSDVYARDYGQRVDDEAKWCVSNCLFYGAASQGICLGTWTSDNDYYMRSRAAAKCGRNYLQTVVNATLFPRGERGDVFSNDDPFTDLGNGDLTVTKTSGARDTAAIRPWMTARARDVYGKKRVSGRERETALPDIGAAEFQYRLGLLLILK